MQKVVVANDHGAVQLAAQIIEHLKNRGYEVNYLGTATEESVDYPDYALKACKEYKKGGYDFGVLCCGTGIGISICANKIKGIVCALPQNCFAAQMAKQHNRANFIAFGGRIDYQESPLDMIDKYIDSEILTDEKYARRIRIVEKIEATQGDC